MVPQSEGSRSIPSIDQIDNTDYKASDYFLRLARSNEAKGIFTTAVVRACFEGDTGHCDDGRSNTCVALGEIHDCEFGLILDFVDEVVITGHVYRVNGVRAYESGEWDAATIERMRNLARRRNPETGNKMTWFGAESEQKAYHDGTHPRFS